MADSITVTDLKQSVEARDPSGLLKKMLDASLPLAKKAALFRVRSPLEPKLEENGLTWDDLLTIIDTIELDDLELAVKQRDGTVVLNKVLLASLPLAKKAALFKLKSVLEPKLNAQGLQWESTQEIVIESVSLDDLKAGDINAIASKILDAAGELGKTMALYRARSVLEPKLGGYGLVWDDVVELADFVTVDDLGSATQNPDDLIAKFIEISGPLAKKVMLHNLGSWLQPLLQNVGLKLADKMPNLSAPAVPGVHVNAGMAEDAAFTIGEMIIETITLDDLKQAVDNQNAQPIMDKLLAASADLAKQVALNMARAQLEPKLVEQGLVWLDAQSMLYLIEIDDLKSGNPQAILDKILQKSTVLAKKVALFKLKSAIEPKLVNSGLTYEDAVKVVYLITLGMLT